MNRVLTGKIESFCRHYNGDPFHAVLCDPPYHLTSIVKRFSKGEPEHTKTAHDIANRSTPHARQAAGFMGKKWDGGDVAFRPETWKALAELLYPGAFVFAFAGTRGYHRMAVAMEDAGLIIHPGIIWCFASGFPKATRIDTQIDRAAGIEQTEIDRVWTGGKRSAGIMGNNEGTQSRDITAAASDKAKEWAGHRYGLQALKPALEHIAVAQKPYKGRSVDCITRTGSGALNIEGGRIGVDSIPSNQWLDNAHPFGGGAGNDYETVLSQGRWPANFILSHSLDCDGSSCAEGCAVRMMDEQSGESISKSGGLSGVDPGMWEGKQQSDRGGHDDSGTASRFFFNADYMHERLEDSDPVIYQAKAGQSERNAGLDTRSTHPTHKPISLCKYLATLLLPPDAYAPRRLFVPFSGAGSEMIGARLAGWNEVVGVEMTPEYANIADARLAWWEAKLADGHTDLDRMLAAWNKESEQDSESGDYQTSIFDFLEEAGHE